MSPASVAAFLEPGSVHFDIVVFDEASQIRVAQAVGTMGRANSVVVVGDSKQMPPTSVMEAAHADEEDNPAVPEDLDSIVAECVESGLPRESLTWHYRSTDESLISVSNTHYYDDKLASLPSPGGDPTAGVSWRRVDGRYDRGTRASSALLGCCVSREGAFAGVACADHEREKLLQFTKNGVESQAGASAFGSDRSSVQKAWARTVRVTWRCQPR